MTKITNSTTVRDLEKMDQHVVAILASLPLRHDRAASASEVREDLKTDGIVVAASEVKRILVSMLKSNIPVKTTNSRRSRFYWTPVSDMYEVTERLFNEKVMN